MWGKLNPRNSIMKLFKSNSRNDLKKNTSYYNTVDSPINEVGSSKNPLLFNAIQPDIEMENIQVPEQVGYNNIPIGHCENDYTTINIGCENDTVIIDTNYQDKSLSPAVGYSDTSYTTYSDTTGVNNISYLSSGIGDSLVEDSTTSTNNKRNSNYYYDENDPNFRNYPDLVLDDSDILKDEIDKTVLEEFEKMNIITDSSKIDSNGINDPLNSKQVNNKDYNKNEILRDLYVNGERDVSSNFSNADTNSFIYSEDEENNNITNYNVGRNYINYNNNKRNTLFAFLEAKANNNNKTDDDLAFSSSEESVNFYDEEDVKQLTEKTISTHSIKEDLRNNEKDQQLVSSPLAQNGSKQETTIINPFY